jgi:hypothetical protein
MDAVLWPGGARPLHSAARAWSSLSKYLVHVPPRTSAVSDALTLIRVALAGAQEVMQRLTALEAKVDRLLQAPSAAAAPSAPDAVQAQLAALTVEVEALRAGAGVAGGGSHLDRVRGPCVLYV